MQAELVACLRESAGNTFQPPGRKPANVLADVIIHCRCSRLESGTASLP